MKDAYESMSGGILRFVQSWLLPSLIAVGVASFALFPAVDEFGVFTDIRRLGSGERTALIGLLALVLAIVLSSVATPLYRVLEGYNMPSKYKEAKRRKHRAIRKALRAEVASSRADPIGRGLAREKLDRYPRSDKYVMPTRLGNALRAGESYGRDQYGLDTVLLWSQLVSVASEDLKEALTHTRTMMDFYAGVFWLSPMFALASVGTALYADSPWHLAGVVSLLVCPLAYSGAVRAAALYAGVLRALVDTSRLGLAARLGLTVPATLDEEHQMWNAFSEFVSWGHGWKKAPEWIATINAARRSADYDEADDPLASRLPGEY